MFSMTRHTVGVLVSDDFLVRQSLVKAVTFLQLFVTRRAVDRRGRLFVRRRIAVVVFVTIDTVE